MSSPHFAVDAPRVSATPTEEVEAAIESAAAAAHGWVRTPTARRAELLRRCLEHTIACAPDWVRSASRAKGLDPDGPGAGQEWLAGVMPLLRNLRLLAEAMDADGAPRPPAVRQRQDGRWVVRVYPAEPLDRVLIAGVRADTWILPGREPTQGHIYGAKARGELRDGGVAAVLGAGNVASIGPMDALTKLFADDEVVVLKANPVNAYLQPFWEEALRPLVDEGVFRVVRGGVEVGQRLVHHPEVSSVHITGSDRTHDAIVWGSDPEEQARRKAAQDPILTKPITSELGAVTPVLVVPGPWTDGDLRYQARHVAGMVENNASFNCTAAQVLVTAARWPQRETFLEMVEEELARTPPRLAYYPGAEQRYAAFLERYPASKALVERSEGVVPWTVIPNVPADASEYALRTEAFCGVLAEVALEAGDPVPFLRKMVPFANDACWGTLSCTMLVHGEVARNYRKELDQAIEGLRYGCISINAFSGLPYGIVTPPWGAFPGHSLSDIRSGRGFVHNTFLLDHPERTVLRAPFRMRPTPPWFSDHRTLHHLGRAMCELEAAPSLRRLPAVLLAGLRG
ncbi:MAG: aldehyde dehydrogenase family protein [Sandaracinaceae bacterium]